MLKAKVNGRYMTAAEIAKWVEANRDYKLSRKTIAYRMRAGLFGEVLISKPSRGVQIIPSKPRNDQKLVRVDIPGWGVRTG